MNDDTDHLPTMSHPKYPNIENMTICIEGVEIPLNNINIHKTSGPDKLQNIILNTCSKEISPALVNIFQQSTGALLVLVPCHIKSNQLYFQIKMWTK